MNIHALRDHPSPELSQALTDFDSRFQYPLGPNRSFRIDHGPDYPRFFRAMGEARCFVAERAGQILGALAVAIRTICLPDTTQRQAAYIGDLKVDPTLRGSLTFPRLAKAADTWARPQVTAAYGIVMDGTPTSPHQYTGRINIPAFLALGKIFILQFPTSIDAPNTCKMVSPTQGNDCYQTLSRTRYHALAGNPTERSQIDPLWLMHSNAQACARLEDTRRAKRLIATDGQEIQSAHLANFAWKTPTAAFELIQSARHHAARLGLPKLFVPVSPTDMQSLAPLLNPIDKIIAPATIYGVGLPPDADWNINTSEI